MAVCLEPRKPSSGWVTLCPEIRVAISLAQRPSLAFARPLLAHLESPRLSSGHRTQIRENPTRETSKRDIILGDVTGPPGCAGVPAEEASPGLCREVVRGCSASSLRPVSVPQVPRGPG